MKNAACCCLLSVLTACHMRTAADLIVHHAVVYTVDDRFSVAQAFAVKGHRILAVGSEEDILGSFEAPEQVDAGGHAVYPGFIDAHAHFFGFGQSLHTADLRGARSWEEALERVRRFADREPGGWITGQGWDQNDWPGQQFPDNRQLNALFPHTPVVLMRVDGHAVLANQAALEAAGLRPGQHVDGGEIVTQGGRLTGLLVDNAVDLLYAARPPLTDEARRRCLLDAEARCFAAGLTTVDDCGLGRHMVEFIDSLQRSGELRMRLYVMLSADPENLDHYLHTGPYRTDRLNVRAFKLFADGALGSRGACLLEPYADRPGWRGFLLKPRAYFEKVARRLAGSSFQMCTHAIGDSANRMMLEIYAAALGGPNDRRWRIEHAQVLDTADIPLFGRYDIVPSVQPTHATSDMYWAGERLGERRLAGAYANRDLLEQNGWIPLGTDFPVEDIAPVKTFYAAVSRRDSAGYPEGGFLPRQALSREQTLRGMTRWAARANFEEREKGSIEPGKFADFVIWDRDIMKVPMPQVLESGPLATYLGGEQVYASESGEMVKK